MTAEKYVNAIVKKIKCGKKRREEIRQQLLSDISAQMSQGRKLDDIMRQMGATSEIARASMKIFPTTSGKNTNVQDASKYLSQFLSLS